MAIFNESMDYDFNSYLRYTDDIEELIHAEGLADIKKLSGLTIQEAASKLAYENAVNFGEISKAIALRELGTFVDSGHKLAYTEGVMTNFWHTIKSFILKIWEKVKTFFKAIWTKISSLFMEKDKWARKFKKEIEKAKVKTYGENFKFNGYNYSSSSMELSNMKSDMISIKDIKILDTTLDELIDSDTNADATYVKDDGTDDDRYIGVSNTAVVSKDKISAFLNEYKDTDKDDIRDSIRGQIANVMGIESDEEELSADDLHDDLIEKLRGGDEDKDELTDIARAVADAEEVLLNGHKKYKKAYDKALKDFNKAIDKSIKKLEDVAKHLESKKKKADITNKMLSGGMSTSTNADDVISDDPTNQNGSLTADKKAEKYNKQRSKYAEVIRAFANALQEASNITTDIISIWTTEYNQWMTQSQSLLIKAMAYKKKEYEDYHEEYIIKTNNSVFEELGL